MSEQRMDPFPLHHCQEGWRVVALFLDSNPCVFRLVENLHQSFAAADYELSKEGKWQLLCCGRWFQFTLDPGYDWDSKNMSKLSWLMVTFTAHAPPEVRKDAARHISLTSLRKCSWRVKLFPHPALLYEYTSLLSVCASSSSIITDRCNGCSEL